MKFAVVCDDSANGESVVEKVRYGTTQGNQLIEDIERSRLCCLKEKARIASKLLRLPV